MPIAILSRTRDVVCRPDCSRGLTRSGIAGTFRQSNAGRDDVVTRAEFHSKGMV